MKPLDAALVLGATMRLTRFVVRDDLGQWLVKDQIDKLWWDDGGNGERAAGSKLSPETQHRWLKYRDGLDCAHCIGFWVGAGVLSSYGAARPHPIRWKLWKFWAAALSLNVIVPVLGEKLDYWSGGEDEDA